MIHDDVMIVTYTNEVKRYCDEKFFTNLYELSKGSDVFVVDNSVEKNYCNELIERFKVKNKYDNFSFIHLDVPIEPSYNVFHRRVTDSVLHLRDIFLQESKYKYFLIVESDVIPPVNLLELLKQDIDKLNEKKWGILGGIYYNGFHDFSKTGIQNDAHVLCGCTLYKRELIEKYPFRWSDENIAAFPDAWICYDSKKEYEAYNDYDIICDHLK